MMQPGEKSIKKLHKYIKRNDRQKAVNMTRVELVFSAVFTL